MHTVSVANRRNWKPLCSRTAMTQNPSQKCAGMPCVTGVLQWWFKLFGSDERGSGGSRVALYGRECLFCAEPRIVMVRLSACGWESAGGRPARQKSWWESVTDHPTRMRQQMNCSMSAWLMSQNCWPMFLWEAFSCRISPGNSSRGEGAVLECAEENFLTQLVSKATKGGGPLDLFTNKEGLVRDAVLRTAFNQRTTKR